MKLFALGLKNAWRKLRGHQIIRRATQGADEISIRQLEARALTESSKTRSRVIIMCSGILKATSPASKRCWQTRRK